MASVAKIHLRKAYLEVITRWSRTFPISSFWVIYSWFCLWAKSRQWLDTLLGVLMKGRNGDYLFQTITEIRDQGGNVFLWDYYYFFCFALFFVRVLFFWRAGVQSLRSWPSHEFLYLFMWLLLNHKHETGVTSLPAFQPTNLPDQVCWQFSIQNQQGGY